MTKLKEVPHLYCSFCYTKDVPMHQAIFVCLTCRQTENVAHNECLCYGCSKRCHGDHEVEFVLFGSAYCDCGKKRCRLVKLSEVETFGRTDNETENYNVIDSHPLYHSVESYLVSIDQHLSLLEQQAVEIATISKDTYWLGYNVAPRCALERFASDILASHVARLLLHDKTVDATACGAEWWVQAKTVGDGIDLHYDKDEELAEFFGLGIFPAVSTVTYFSELTVSLPTLIFDATAEDPTGLPIRKLFLSRPQSGKHIAFDGRLLHGAPPIFEEDFIGPVTRSKRLKSDSCGGSAAPSSSTPSRVTFLVNVWVHHRPAIVRPLPDSLVELLNNNGPTNAEKQGDCGSNSSRSSSGSGLGLQLMDTRSVTVAGPQTATRTGTKRKKAGREVKSGIEGSWGETPFLSDKVAWGKADDESGVNVRYWKPTGLSEPGASYAINYVDDESSATLRHTGDDDNSVT